MINLKENPFYLTDKEVEFVDKTLAEMNIKEKIGQLFFLQGLVTNKTILAQIINQIGPGGMVFRKGELGTVRELNRFAQKTSNVPLFIGGDADCGSEGVIEGGFSYGNNLLLAATDDTELTKKVTDITSIEISNAEVNTVFGPNVDIDYNWRSSLQVNNTFGTDPLKVISHAKTQMDEFEKRNILSVLAQFPGNGVDERHSHLIGLVNSLDVEEWESNYGYIYKKLISEGAKAISVGNISLPKYAKHINPDIDIIEERAPASLSVEILQGLLRKELRFNGLIISDITMLNGFAISKKRSELLPLAIANGCDMIICTKDYIQDYKYVLQGCKNGIITEKRLNDAVKRILATKVSMKLYDNNVRYKSIIDYDIRVHKELSRRVADEGITLLKDHVELLPLPTLRKILLFDVNEESKEGGTDLVNWFKEELGKRGCLVEQRTFDYKSSFVKDGEFEKDLKNKYDVIIVLLNLNGTKLSSAMKLDLLPEIALKSPLYNEEIPSIFISFGNPYHSYDVPMVKTFINCYASTREVVDKVVKKIFGESEFCGKSPVATIFDYYGYQVEIDYSKVFKPGAKKKEDAPKEKVKKKKAKTKTGTTKTKKPKTGDVKKKKPKVE